MNKKFPTIAKWTEVLKPSSTLVINAMAQELKKQGKKVLSFAAGEPDFDTPQHIKDAACESLKRGETKYTPVPGIIELRKAISQFHSEKHGINYAPEEIIVTTGAKQAISHFFMSILDPGEGVIIPSPYWISYPQQVLLSRGEPIFIKTNEKNNWKLDPSEIKKAYKRGTKAIVINNPNNPLGKGYSKKELEEIINVADELNLWILADEIYSELCYDNFKFHSIGSLGEDIKKRTVIINGVSKTFSMTGWRMGWGMGPVEIIKKMGEIQGQTTSCATSFAQYGTLAGLQHDLYFFDEWLKKFSNRRNLIVDLVSQIHGVTFNKPEGAFYLFVNFSNYVNKKASCDFQINNAIDLAKFLLQDSLVAVVPGDGFGISNFLRFSYACSEETITEGITRIAESLKKLS